MTTRHADFCQPGDVFFDRAREDPGDAVFEALAPLPATGWTTLTDGTWRHLRPAGSVLPDQGWKVHVAATPATASRVLTESHTWCVDHRITYKHLRSPHTLLRSNSKYAARESSGKFLTLYPAADEQLAAILDGLGARLAGLPGPYILSDRRIGAGPLHVRYGGFRRLELDDGETTTPAIRTPSGALVPDPRKPGFRVPDWVTPPPALAGHLAPRAATELPWRITAALHFSNGGGVYRAEPPAPVPAHAVDAPPLPVEAQPLPADASGLPVGAPPLSVGAPPLSAGASALPVGAPPLSAGVSGLPVGAPPLSAGASGLPVGAPPLSAGVSGLPVGAPPFPAGASASSVGGSARSVGAPARAEALLVKEARPHAGLDAHGIDAVARLRREHAALAALAGIPGIPAVHGLHEIWEHLFLARDFAPGTSLNRWLARHYPMTADAAPRELTAYRGRAMAVADRLDALVARVHARGWVLGDLHPGNVLIGVDDELALIDLELAFEAATDETPGMAAAGFGPPPDVRGFARDTYALAAIRLWLLLPLTPMAEITPAVTETHLSYASRRFALSPSTTEALRITLRVPHQPAPPRPAPAPPRPAPLPPRPEPGSRLPAPSPSGPPGTGEPGFADARGWPVLRAKLVRAIEASATPGRDDRLFPGDPEQFASGGLSLGHGAAGVLLALRQAGAACAPEHVAWLRSHARTAPARPGLWRGGHGVAYVLDLLGHPGDADALLRRCTPAADRPLRPGLAGGATGIALTLAALAASRDTPELLTEASTLAERIAALPAAAAPAPGLMTGWTGPALLFLRLYERTADPAWLDHADTALSRDLAAAVTVPSGGLQLRDGRRTLPYLDRGSAGVLLVAAQLVRHRPAARAAAALPGLVAGCRQGFVIYPGLLSGRAGLAVALSVAGATTAASAAMTDLGLYAVPHAGGTAFPGVTLRRLSMDLHTGTAGVLLALTQWHEHRPALPLLLPPHTTGRAPAGRGTIHEEHS